jgi:hypothetical protein
LLRKKPKSVITPASPRVQIGSIQMTNPELRFALIQSIDRASIPVGADLISSNAVGETSKLKLSPERKGPFLTADIISGEPAKGDVVTWLRGGATAAVENPPPAAELPSARISIPMPTAVPLPEPVPAPPPP